MEYDNTLGYYDSHAEQFYKSTVNVEFTAMQERFLEKLPKGSYILDFGCGSGRDTKFFLEQEKIETTGSTKGKMYRKC